MILLRLLFIVVPLILVISFGLYLVTQNRSYLLFAQKTLRVVVFLLLILGLLFVIERYVFSGMALFV